MANTKTETALKPKTAQAAENAIPKAANNNQIANNSKQLKLNFNQYRGLFMSEFARYEFLLCETIHAIKKNTEIIKNEIPNTNSARTDVMLNLTTADNNLNSKLGQLKASAKEIEKFETLRNFLAHGYLNLLKDDEGKDVFMLLTFANNGQSVKKEVEFINTAALKKAYSHLVLQVDIFANHAQSIKSLWIAS